MQHQYTHRKALAERAKSLRKNQTKPERRLWSKLRKKQLDGRKFRRQHILEPFIVDFYCTSCRIAVEVDGPEHQKDEQAQRDERRDELLAEQHDVRVLRFDVVEIYSEMDAVLEQIREACEEAEEVEEE